MSGGWFSWSFFIVIIICWISAKRWPKMRLCVVLIQPTRLGTTCGSSKLKGSSTAISSRTTHITHTHTHSHKRALNMDNNEKKWHLRERSVSLECYSLRAFYSLKLTTTTAACNANIVRDGAPSSLVLRVAPFVSIVEPFFFCVCYKSPFRPEFARYCREQCILFFLQ